MIDLQTMRFTSEKIGIDDTTESSQEAKIFMYLKISPCRDTKWDFRAHIFLLHNWWMIVLSGLNSQLPLWSCLKLWGFTGNWYKWCVFRYLHYYLSLRELTFSGCLLYLIVVISALYPCKSHNLIILSQEPEHTLGAPVGSLQRDHTQPCEMRLKLVQLLSPT